LYKKSGEFTSKALFVAIQVGELILPDIKSKQMDKDHLDAFFFDDVIDTVEAIERVAGITFPVKI
jgi:hypothetical protein